MFFQTIGPNNAVRVHLDACTQSPMYPNLECRPRKARMQSTEALCLPGTGTWTRLIGVQALWTHVLLARNNTSHQQGVSVPVRVVNSGGVDELGQEPLPAAASFRGP